MREQAVIKEWNKKGIGGLRASSLLLLENIGGRGVAGRAVGGRDVNEDVMKVLCRHTLRMLPQGLWKDAERYCQEICFLADVSFDEIVYSHLIVEEMNEREDEEFGEGEDEEFGEGEDY